MHADYLKYYGAEAEGIRRSEVATYTKAITIKSKQIMATAREVAMDKSLPWGCDIRLAFSTIKSQDKIVRLIR